MKLWGSLQRMNMKTYVPALSKVPVSEEELKNTFKICTMKKAKVPKIDETDINGPMMVYREKTTEELQKQSEFFLALKKKNAQKKGNKKTNKTAA
jgi:DNA-directed RNA polymerase subunit H (RpoH/RPB5)